MINEKMLKFLCLHALFSDGFNTVKYDEYKMLQEYKALEAEFLQPYVIDNTVTGLYTFTELLILLNYSVMVNFISEDMNILEKYHLCPNELFIIRIFLLAQEDDDISFLQRYLSIPEYDRGNLRNILIRLQDKEVILKSCKIPNTGENFYPNDITFNKTFIKGFYKASFDMGKELFEAYPMFGSINGSVKSCALMQ